LVTAVLLVLVWLLPFKWIERTFGLLGLTMLVFLVAAVALRPDWPAVAGGAVPTLRAAASRPDLLAYGYFAVAILTAVMFPYETYFYSSGGIEEGWTRKDLGVNRLTTSVGFSLGSLLAISILVAGAVLFRPQGIGPQSAGSALLIAAVPLGSAGLAVALGGVALAFAGAAVETCLSSAYGLAQFFGWEWGRYEKPLKAPRFTAAWCLSFLAALAVVLSGVKPLDIVEWVIVTAVVLIPVSYACLLVAAGDRRSMGANANGLLSNVLGWGFLVILTLAALAAIPLYVLTAGGKA
jgi:manganese transport protein